MNSMNQTKKVNQNIMIVEDSESNDNTSYEDEDENDSFNENIDNCNVIQNINRSNKNYNEEEKAKFKAPQSFQMGLSKISSIPKFSYSYNQSSYLNLINEIGSNSRMNSNNTNHIGNNILNKENNNNKDSVDNENMLNISTYKYLNFDKNNNLNENSAIIFPLSSKQLTQIVKFLGAIFKIRHYNKKKFQDSDDHFDAINILMEYTNKVVDGQNASELSFYNSTNYPCSSSKLTIKVTDETLDLFNCFNKGNYIPDFVSMLIRMDYEILKRLIIDKNSNYILFKIDKEFNTAHLKIEIEPDNLQFTELDVIAEDYGKDISKEIFTLIIKDNNYLENELTDSFFNQFRPLFFETGFNNIYFNYDKGEFSINYLYTDGGFKLRLSKSRLLANDIEVKNNIEDYFPINFNILIFTEYLKLRPDVLKLYFRTKSIVFEMNNSELGIKYSFINSSTAVQ